jgi:hypothetical protein
MRERVQKEQRTKVRHKEREYEERIEKINNKSCNSVLTVMGKFAV